VSQDATTICDTLETLQSYPIDDIQDTSEWTVYLQTQEEFTSVLRARMLSRASHGGKFINPQ
jgi:hypothetical protein